MEYDDRNRISRAVDAAGNESQQGYDASGNRTWSEDANGNRFEYKFSDLNMPTEVWDMNQPVDPNNPPVDEPREGVDYKVRSKTQYDTAGRKVAEVDAMGRVVTFTYNADDSLKSRKLVEFHDPDGTTRDVVLEDNTYDNAGNRIQSTDPNNVVTRFGYDYAGRQVRSSDAMGRSSVAAYDKAGQLVTSKTLNSSNARSGPRSSRTTPTAT